MTRRGWVLFAAMSVIWGVPYLLIKVAVRELSPPVLVATRCGLAALVLVPIAAHRGSLMPALRRWRPLLAFTVLEMAIPWLLLTDAEQHLPSGLTGLLVATVPLAGAVVAFGLGDRGALRPGRVVGVVLGMAGVGLLVGVGDGLGGGSAWNVAEVLIVAVGYASAPFVADRHLSDVPTLGVVAASLGIVTLAYLPAAIWLRPTQLPVASVLAAAVALAILCTGIAFVVFFALIAEVGPQRATLITFLNPAVAVALGVVVLNEHLGTGIVVGFPLILGACWLTTRSDRHPVEAALGATGG